MRCALVLTSTVAVLAGFGALAQQPATSPELSKEVCQAVLSTPEDDRAFDEFLRRLPTVTLGGQTRRNFYVLEGDLLLTREQVRAAILYQAKGERPTVSSGELLVMVEAGKPVFWNKDQR